MGVWMAARLALGVLSAGVSAGDGPMEVAGLERASGGPARLSALRGTPVILFYEDRHSFELNQGLKDELYLRGQERGLLDAVRVVGVANLAPFDFFPAKPIALGFVRDAQAKVGIPLWVDWKGTLGGAPWGLPLKTSSVVVLDRDGVVVFARSGKLGDAEQEELFRALDDLLADAPPAR
jgi:hypothetical protein